MSMLRSWILGYHQISGWGNLLRKKPSFGLIRQCRLIAGLHSGFSRPGFSWERVRTLSVFWTFVRESQLSRIVGHGRLVRWFILSNDRHFGSIRIGASANHPSKGEDHLPKSSGELQEWRALKVLLAMGQTPPTAQSSVRHHAVRQHTFMRQHACSRSALTQSYLPRCVVLSTPTTLTLLHRRDSSLLQALDTQAKASAYIPILGNYCTYSISTWR